MKLRVLDLFSGIGGFSLGLERTGGFETVAFCEIEPFCRRVLAKHWPEVPCYDDVRTVSAARLAADGIERIDAICGGFPCQDISLAGRKVGIEGERSGLWREIARLVREFRPGVLLLENVAALLGLGLDRVLGDLAALGYDAEWDCIPASAVGAPHRRDRIWIVAHPRGEQHEGRGDAFRRALAAGLPEAFVANTAGGGVRRWRNGPEALAVHGGAGGPVADAALRGWNEQPPTEAGEHQGWLAAGGRHSAHGGIWAAEPAVGRVAHGVPARVDRLHALGNAVVPQIPELIGRAILQSARPVGAACPQTGNSGTNHQSEAA